MKMKKLVVCLSLLAVFLIDGISNACGQDATDESQVSRTVSSSNRESDDASSRSFNFHYGATIKELPAGAKVRVWFPVAESNAQQEVRIQKTDSPSSMQFNRDEKYSNQIGYFETASEDSGSVNFQLKYDVERQEASVEGGEERLTEKQKQLFLSANSLVPLHGRAQELIKDQTLPPETMAAGKSLYDFVEQHMKYDKSNPGYGKGDVLWACDSKTGNCTDFHSLFISLARSKSIPARFEIGFPIPTEPTGVVGGYHCWAWFHADGSGWTPVDISEADKHPELKNYYFGKLTADRVAFSTGRDIALVPESKSGPLNYFVYPHVEVDGQIWPKEKIELKFEYANQ